MSELVRDFAGIRLSIYDAGTFTDDAGKPKEFAAGIKISKGSYGLKLTAHEVASLYQLLKTDKDVKAELTRRLEEEKAQVMQSTF